MNLIGKTYHYLIKSTHSQNLVICIIAFAGLMMVTPHTATAQQDVSGPIEIAPGGSMWIEGSASVVDYRCNAEKLSGDGRIKDRENPEESVRAHGDVAITVSIPVKALECGKRGMNKDMLHALKAKQHPNITYTLLDASLLQRDANEVESAPWMKIRTTGLLTIAGITDTTEVIIDGQVMEGNRFRVKGNKQINMHDYSIKPPQALLGLIKADEKLMVHFDVTVRLKD